MDAPFCTLIQDVLLKLNKQTNKGHKMKMKLALLFPLISLTLSASNEARVTKAKELLNIMQMTKMMDTSFDQILKYSDQMISSQGLSSEAQAQAKTTAKKSMEISFKAVKDIDWITMFSEIYSDVFTEQELQELINFYKSPIGKKMLEKQPVLMQQTMQKMQGEIAKIMPKIQQGIQNAIQDAKK